MDQDPASVTACAVRVEMARRRVSIRQLAEGTGITKTSLGRRLSGEYPFTISQLVAVAQCLEVPLTTLLPIDTERAA